MSYGIRGRSIVPGRARSLLIVFVVATAATAATLFLFLPQPVVTIHARWAPGVPESDRTDFEAALGLADPRPAGERTWAYVLEDPSSRMIRTIVQHPTVEDTAHVNRRWYRPAFWSDRLRLIAFFSVFFGLVACPIVLLLEATGWLLESGSHWNRWALVATLIVGATVSVRVWQTPMQVSDSLIPMLQAQAAPGASPFHFLNERSFLRPVYWSQIRALLGPASRSSYHHVFKGVQVALVMLLFICFAWAARVMNATDFSAFLLALLVMVGAPSFTGMVAEAYPINHYLEIAVACLASLGLVRGQPHRWTDAAAILLFAAATLTLESGLLVFVVLFVGRLLGWRGVSRPALIGIGAIFCAYFYVRLAYLGTGVPDLEERATGFGFSRLEPVDTMAMFAGRELALYAYNVASAVLSILFSEPSGGQFVATAAWTRGELRPAQAVAIASSLLTTAVIVRFLFTRLRSWRHTVLDDDLRLVIVAATVVAGNAAFCAVYVKDEILSAACVFYALAVYVSVRVLVSDAVRLTWRGLRLGMVSAMLLLTSLAWDVRALSLHYRLQDKSIATRGEWAAVDEWLDRQGAAPVTADGVAMVAALREEAARMPVRHARFVPRWTHQWLE